MIPSVEVSIAIFVEVKVRIANGQFFHLHPLNKTDESAGGHVFSQFRKQKIEIFACK